jgi:C4-dicarboxylate transporter, DctM subunit
MEQVHVPDAGKNPALAPDLQSAYFFGLLVIPKLNFGHLRSLPRDFAHADLIYSLPLITIGAASAFGWMLAYLRGPIVVPGWISGLAGQRPLQDHVRARGTVHDRRRLYRTDPVHCDLYADRCFIGLEICRVRFSQALRASLSIYVVFFVTIAATIFLPDVVLWLPKHLFPEAVGCFQEPERRRLHLPLRRLPDRAVRGAELEKGINWCR